MTQLAEILSPTLLATEVAEGWIRKQKHPHYPELSILNYTEKTQFERHWNDATRMCRGLILNEETGEILARPFPKIHNFDEAEAPRIVDNQVLYHWDNKWDGSLGIVYRMPNGILSMATRGSFASEQAIEGTRMLYELNDEQWSEVMAAIDEGYTPLFEIIYPNNRIVIDYEGESFLAALGYIHIATGAFTPGEAVKRTKRTMHDMLMDLSRDNAEGWVAWLTPYKAVKIKQADYVELHRIVTGLSFKEVWRQCRAGTYDEFAAKLPDEFYRMVEDWAGELWDNHATIRSEARAIYDGLLDANLQTRKEQAEWVLQFSPTKYRGLVFAQLDNKDITDAIWKMLEPVGNSVERVAVDA